MRKTLFSVLPLVVLLTPIAARLHFRPSPEAGHAGATTTVEASGLRPDQAALRHLQTRIQEARQLLDSQPETGVTDAVMLAVADATGAGLQFVELPKEVFLSQGAEAVVGTALGPLKLRVERPNYVNTSVSVTDAKGRALQPLLVRYPVEKNGALKEIAYYTSAHPALGSPELIRGGREYVSRSLEEAARELALMGKPVEPGVLEAAERLCLVEHVDHKRFKTEDHGSIFDEVYTLYALNSGDTYRYSVSSAGAGGMVQMIPPTYKAIREQHPEAALRADFVEGMRDHSNALKAMLLYMQGTWDDLLKKEEVRLALHTGVATQPELLAAGYNSNPARLHKYLARGGTAWRTLIPEETQMYLRIYASVESLVPFKPRA